MPLDPMIANPLMMKLGSPVEDYKNHLILAGHKATADKARRDEANQNALTEAYRLHTNDKGVTDRNGMRSYLAQNRIGTAIPGVDKGWADLDETTAKVGLEQAKTATEGFTQQEKAANATNTNADAFKQVYENYKQKLSGASTQEHVESWMRGMFLDKTMGPVLAAQGTPEQAIEGFREMLKTVPLDQAILRLSTNNEIASKQHYVQSNTGTHIVNEAVPANSLGPVKPQQVSKLVRTPDPKAVTNVHVNTPVSVNVAAQKLLNAYEEGAGKDQIAEDTLLRNAARGAGPAIERIQQMQALLRTGRPLTGAAAGIGQQMLSLASAAGIKVDEKMLSDTQLLSTAIANDSLGRIAALKQQGVSLTPMSDSDRKFVAEAGMRTTHTAATMSRLLAIEEKFHRDANAAYSARFKAIKSNPYTAPGAAILGQQDFPVPPPTSTTPPAKAIADLRANPKLAAQFEAKYKLPPGSAQRYIKGGN